MNEMLSEAIPNSVVARRVQTNKQIEVVRAQLSAPQRALEEHKAQLKQWESVRAQLEGDENQLGSLKQIQKALLQMLPTIRERAQNLRRERLAKAREIYKEKQKLRDVYGRYYGAVQAFFRISIRYLRISSLS